MEGHEPTPGIVRDVSDEDMPTAPPRVNGRPAPDRCDKIISQPADRVSHSRGWGDSGYRVQVVNHECPECVFDRMIRRIDVTPERRNSVRYWCLNPNCVHYVRDKLSHACTGSWPSRDTDSPAIMEDRL